jgi:acetyl esterase/lipase
MFLGLLVLFGGRAGHALSWYAIAGATFSLFWGGVGLHASVAAALVLGSREAGCRRIAGTLVASVGVIVFVVHLLPAAALPLYLQRSRQAFDAVMDSTGPELRRTQEGGLPAGFKSTPFALTGYFLGIPRQRCEIRRDVLFFDGGESSLPEERNLRLYFDAYLPFTGAGDSSAPRPVLIRLHGGGWRLGDKGTGNMMQMNRYFAAQGYAVFDVQYGLKGDPARPPVITPTHVLGSFDLDDMMRHLGYFTRYLREKAPEYGADLGAVFVSGGSAGGQLACALALALDVGEAPELFGDGINILGLVPFYPANGVSASWIGGQERWRNPEGLVRADSPPCLIFQGNQDGMVEPETSLRFCRAYRAAGNPACAVLRFPFAPHAADIYFPGYYNQVFLYFMERFLHAQRQRSASGDG